MVITADRCNDHPTGAGGTYSFAPMVRRLRPTGHTGCVMQSFLPASRQARKLKTTLLLGLEGPTRKALLLFPAGPVLILK